MPLYLDHCRRFGDVHVHLSISYNQPTTGEIATDDYVKNNTTDYASCIGEIYCLNGDSPYAALKVDWVILNHHAKLLKSRTITPAITCTWNNV